MRKLLGTAAVFLIAVTAIVSKVDANGDEELAQRARRLLTAQLSTDVDITTESVERVTWPSGALGCPKPGMNYTQSLVPGYRIVLVANGRKYSYHGRDNGEPFYCASPENSSGWIMDR